MTGFGEASCQVGGAHYFLEIRSLNSKYFKAVLRLPEELQGLEAELESELRHRLSRGSVFMSVKHSDSSAEAAYRINDRALERYIEQIRKVPQIAKGDVELDVASLLTLPGVLQPPSDEEQRLAAARGVLKTLVAKACDALLAMREKEGRLIHKELMAHREEISQRIRLVSARSPKVMTEYESRLKAKIQQMIEELGVAVETVDIVREIAIAAERVDTAEEIARLSGHIDQFAELLSDKDPKPIGRTLDFLTQEMLREANTIASKCNDAEIARWTVEIKGAIDRIKEQVQNVE